MCVCVVIVMLNVPLSSYELVLIDRVRQIALPPYIPPCMPIKYTILTFVRDPL